MYSQQGGRPGASAPKMANRYMKGRLPEGVDFAAYPGRSSTPLPTAESKSAERINQLKIWNEAATNDDKRRLNAAKGMGAGPPNPSAARRTDSFKDAKDRHSASFHGTPPPSNLHSPSSGDGDPDHIVSDAIAHPPSYHRTAVGSVGTAPQRNTEMFADRSDSDSDEDPDETGEAMRMAGVSTAAVADNVSTQRLKAEVESGRSTPALPPQPAASVPAHTATPSPARATNPNISKSENIAASARPEPKESKACCMVM